MDPFAHLHYRYPGTPSTARRPVSQHPQGVPYHHVPVQNMQSVQGQAHLGDVYTRSDPGRIMRARPSLDLMAGHGVHPQQKDTSVVPRSAVHADPASLVKMQYVDELADLPDQYVPSSSDKITCTDHRPLDEIFGNMRPSSGWTQAKPNPLHLTPNGTSRGNPRQASSVLTYPLPAKPQLAGVVQIPLLAVDNRMNGTGLVVDFRCSDWGIGVQVEGIPMPDLLRGNVVGLEDPHQRVLDGLGLADVRLNILWPHYPPFAKVISAFGTDGKPLTRAGLGYEVSLAFAEFFFYITSRSISPTQPGPYEICSSRSGLSPESSTMSPSSSPGIRFDQLHLITMRNTSRGEWVAEIRAVLES